MIMRNWFGNLYLELRETEDYKKYISRKHPG